MSTFNSSDNDDKNRQPRATFALPQMGVIWGLLMGALVGSSMAGAQSVPTVELQFDSGRLGYSETLINEVVIWPTKFGAAAELILTLDDEGQLLVHDGDLKLIDAIPQESGGAMHLVEDVLWERQSTDLVVVSIPEETSIKIYRIAAGNRPLIEYAEFRLDREFATICLGRHQKDQGLVIYGVQDDGDVYIIKVESDPLGISREGVFSVGGNVSSCAVNRSGERAYFAERELGIWQVDLEDGNPVSRSLVDARLPGVTDFQNADDISLIETASGQDFLLSVDGRAKRLRLYQVPAGIPVVDAPVSNGFRAHAIAMSVGKSLDLSKAGSVVVAGQSPDSDRAYNVSAASASPIQSTLGSSILARNVEDLRIDSDGNLLIEPVFETRSAMSQAGLAGEPFILNVEGDGYIFAADGEDWIRWFDDEGVEIGAKPIGAISSISGADAFAFEDGIAPVLAISDIDSNSIQLMRFDHLRNELVEASPAFQVSSSELTSVCVFSDTKDSYIYFTTQVGSIGQLIIEKKDGYQANLRRVRGFLLSSQLDHCAIDDQRRVVYVAEREVAVWQFDAIPEGELRATVIGQRAPQGSLQIPITTVAEWDYRDRELVVIGGSETSEFSVFEVDPQGQLVGRFKIDGSMTGLIDEVSSVSSIDIHYSERYPDGLLVVRDRFNRGPEGQNEPNLKYVDLSQVGLGLGL